MKRDAAEVLRRTETILDVARVGLADLESEDEARRTAGLLVVVVFGRSVTFVLQGLRSAVPEGSFDEWYAPRRNVMERDKLLRFFHRMRSPVLKEGNTGTEYTVSHLSATAEAAREMAALYSDFPPETLLRISEAGFEWILADDPEVVVKSVPLPEGVELDDSIRFVKPPNRHLGQKLHDNSAAGLARLYLAYLAEMVADAKSRFGAEPRLFEGPQPPAP